jgi:hypothetical protein
MHQQLRKSITTLAFVLVSAIPAGAMAQTPKAPLALNPDAPDRYVVVPGDTLWSIAQRYTDSPWRWSELWNLNKDEIKDPNRIYPGNIIVLDRARGQLALDSTVKLSPKVRAESMAMTVIPSIPPNVIEPFLSRPLVIEPDGLDNAPTIVAADSARSVLEAGSRGFTRGMGNSKETDWFLYRRGQPLVDPETKTTLGYEAIYLGTARVFQAGEPAIIEVTSVTREVVIGDKLVPAGKPQIPVYAPRAPSTAIQGQVIALYGNRAQLAEAGWRHHFDQPRQVAGGRTRQCARAVPPRHHGRGRRGLEVRLDQQGWQRPQATQRTLRPGVCVPRLRPGIVRTGHAIFPARAIQRRCPESISAGPG